MNPLRAMLHYQYRCARLGLGFLTGRFINCNLQVTYRCNFKCRICDFWKTGHSESEELSLDDIRAIGRKLNRLGTLIISLAGGEPLMRDDLAGIIRVLNEENHFPILITNGWFVDDARAREIQNAGLQEISVSIDYADAARHDAQRGMPGAWEKAVRALELLNRYRPTRRHRVHMISVLMDDNLDDVEPLIKLSRDLGVTYMLSLHSSNRGAKPSRAPGSKVTDRLLALKARYGEFVTLTSYIERLDEAIMAGGVGDCMTGRLLMNIDCRGNVARCTETIDEPVANILRDDIITVRDRLYARQKGEACAKCWTSCRGFAESMSKRPRLRQLREFYVSTRSH
jgi:MoaA/NifB/PqqE/SkfB family radical SAM enzyme